MILDNCKARLFDVLEAKEKFKKNSITYYEFIKYADISECLKIESMTCAITTEIRK